jgi:hypothetical protein
MKVLMLFHDFDVIDLLFHDFDVLGLLSVADLEGGVRGVRGVRAPPPLKFAKHMLYNVN